VYQVEDGWGVQDKAAMSETVANVCWLIAAGIRDFQIMLDELGKLQSNLPRDAPAPDEPIQDDQAAWSSAASGEGLVGGLDGGHQPSGSSLGCLG
jgi:hypothetical protein